MSTEPQSPDARTATERPPGPLPEGSAEERADIAEDRRPQRGLDDAEPGGEAWTSRPGAAVGRREQPATQASRRAGPARPREGQRG